MRPHRLVLIPFSSIILFASVCEAQVQRTFVSGSGSDGNPCSRTAPCRTFTQAISQTSAGGEVIVLDSAGYGAFTITQSVTVQAAPGAYAGISVFSDAGVDINAGSSDTVILRGLSINSQGGTNGIVFNTGGSLHVENCVVNGFAAGSGISFQGPGQLVVKDSIARGNADGMVVAGTTFGYGYATIEGVTLVGNSHAGLVAGFFSRVTIRNSVASNNSNGLHVLATGFAAVENCTVSENAHDGITAFSSVIDGNLRGGFALVSNSTVSFNLGIGLNNSATDNSMRSYGNNRVLFNNLDTFGLIVTEPPR